MQTTEPMTFIAHNIETTQQILVKSIPASQSYFYPSELPQSDWST